VNDFNAFRPATKHAVLEHDGQHSASRYPPDLQKEAIKTVLQQAELLCADWAVE